MKTSKISYFQSLKILLFIRKTYNQLPKPMKLKKSWITSLFGAGGLATIAYNTVSMIMDGDVKTNPDWSIVIQSSIIAIGLLFAKDFNQSNATKPMEESKAV